MATPAQSPAGINHHSQGARERRRHWSAGQRRQLQQAKRLESIATLAGGLAHDLNNVFSPIITFAELLRRKVAGKDERQCLDLLVGNAWRGADIVRQMLTFADGLDGERVELSVADLVKDACQIIRGILPSRIALEVDLQSGLWPIAGNLIQLRQVIMNISLNALEAIAGDGRLLIRAQNTRVKNVIARGHPGAAAGPHTLVTVADNGCGIPRELFERVFDPFFTTKSPGTGRGLGLSIAHGIVRNHGGFLHMRSKADRGSELRIYLPAISPEPNLKSSDLDYDPVTNTGVGPRFDHKRPLQF